MFSFEDAERVAADFQTRADALPPGEEKSDLLEEGRHLSGACRNEAFSEAQNTEKTIDGTIEKTTDKTD